MPTVLILLFTLLIMVTVIPYAFSSVIKQLQAVRKLEEQQGDHAEGGGGRGGRLKLKKPVRYPYKGCEKVF